VGGKVAFYPSMTPSRRVRRRTYSRRLAEWRQWLTSSSGKFTPVLSQQKMKICKTLKNAVFSDVAPCRSCVNRRLGGKYRFHLQGRKISELQPPAHAGSSLADFSSLKMEAIFFSETWVHTRSTRRYISEDGILHSHGRENIKSYIQNLNFSYGSVWVWNMVSWH
jgi:hypothetical protein